MSVAGKVECLGRELLFAVKVTVDSPFSRPVRLHQIGQGRSVITPLMKMGAACE